VFGEENEKLRKVVSQAESLENRFKSGTEFERAFADFGLCKDCGNLLGCYTKYDNRYARCDILIGVKLSPQDPVKKCTSYYKKGQLDIHTMKDMAILIDIQRPIGFGKEDEDGKN
jgi:hypothetical protein